MQRLHAVCRAWNPRANGLAVLAHDSLMAGLSLPLAIYLRRGEDAFEHGTGFLVREALIFAAIAALVFLVLRSYRGLWRYTGAAELLSIGHAVTLAILLYLPVAFAVGRLTGVPRSVPIIQWLCLMLMLGGPRFAARLWARRHQVAAEAGTPVLLVGSGHAAASLLRALSAMPQPPVRVLGLLAADARDRGRSIGTAPVLGTVEELEAVVRDLARSGRRPERLILAEALDGSRLRRLVGAAERLGQSVAQLRDRAVLGAALGGGKVELQPVPLSELLGRPPVALAREAVARAIEGRRVLVTGAGGSIGSELVRQIAAFQPARLVLLDSSEYALYAIDGELGRRFPSLPRVALLGDVRDRARIRQVFAAERPELVFHAAALKHVPMVELNPTEGAATNVLGTRNVADAAAAHGVRAMVQISTDKAVNPASVMGATKRLAELYCQALDVAGVGLGRDRSRERRGTRFVTVRFGNVLGSSGSVVPHFQRQLAAGGPLTVTHPEIRRYFMLVHEAVELVLQALAHGLRGDPTRGEILVLDMGEPIRIADLARHMIRLAGKEPDRDVRIEFTGLRPGEKLTEELFDHGEERRPALSGILSARSRPGELGQLRYALDELEMACALHDESRVAAIIARLVPGYAAAPARSEAA